MPGKKVHGGNLTKLIRKTGNSDFIDFSANINPLGFPEWLRPLISSELENIVYYPDPENLELTEAIAACYQIGEKNILAGNGTSELLYNLLRQVRCKRVVLPVPCYIDYHDSARLAGHTVVNFPLKPTEKFELNLEEFNNILRDGDLTIIGCPNNPTGCLPNIEKLKKYILQRQNITFVLDEAFAGFVEDFKSFAGMAENIITLNSLTKFFAIPGLRLGFLTASSALIKRLKDASSPWSVNYFAQKAGVRALADKAYKEESLGFLVKNKKNFYQALCGFAELEVFDSVANFFLVRLKAECTADQLKKKLIDQRIVIRSCSNYEGLDDSYFRIAVRRPEENEQFLQALHKVFGKTARIKQRKTPAIMVQGTCSNAGKSIISAALCRIFLQDGINVAPFKAQNMSLNSFVTMDGGEMGRAQVVQAQAARLAPGWLMNPVLLKPHSDTGSQVIVHGKPVANMNVHQYHKYKTEAWSRIKDAYDKLAARHELLVLEGAGSPGEVNLKQHDIVNMRMAEYAQAPVLLAGDIDRGGVYASFVGIMEVLAEWERKLVCGFLVNRFRGDKTLLASAHEYVKFHTGKDVLGVIPFIDSLGLPEEDSVSFKLGDFKRKKPDVEHVVIGVVHLAHISNFTDFEPFLEEPDVHLIIVDQAAQLDDCDALVLPGSKNVVGDLKNLKEKGLFEAIRHFAGQGKTVVGICGGYQILGNLIIDKDGVESQETTVNGLGLLDISTTMARDKTLTRKSGHHTESNKLVYGYEIHHGITEGKSVPLFCFDDKSSCGASSGNGQIWGAYLHGMFDADDFRRWFIDGIRENKGYRPVGQVLYCYDLEKEFERLAAIVRDNLDIQRLYSLTGL